jgi:hypothetical protein
MTPSVAIPPGTSVDHLPISNPENTFTDSLEYRLDLRGGMQAYWCASGFHNKYFVQLHKDHFLLGIMRSNRYARHTWHGKAWDVVQTEAMIISQVSRHLI